MNLLALRTLKGNNYDAWRSWMKSYLVSEDLWDIVDGADTIPPEDTEENSNALKEWNKKNARAEFVLKSTISDYLFDPIIDCDSASSIWNALYNWFP